MNRTRHTILGAFFLMTVGALGFFTIYLGGFEFGDRQFVEVFFARADGLQRGDAVHIFGVPSGKVEDIAFTGSDDPERRLMVTLTLTRPMVLREGLLIEIAEQSLLGGRRIDLEPGDGEPLAGGVPLIGQVQANALASLQALVDENREPVKKAMESLSSLADRLDDGQPLGNHLLGAEAMDNLGATLASFRETSEKINQGPGSLAQLINEPKLHDQFLNFLDQGGVLFQEAVEGEGVLPQLLKDGQMYEDLRSASESIKNILARVDGGVGLAGKLLTDQSDPMYEDAREIVARWRTISENITAGDSVLSRFIMDGELGNDTATLVADLGAFSSQLSELMDDVRRGRGVLGYLVADDEARREVSRIVNMISGSLEDAREAAPVSSFASFLFGQL